MLQYVLIFVLGLLASTGCGHKRDPAPEGDNRAALVELRAALVSQYQPQTAGWPSDHDCDGLLWAGVAAAAGLPVDLDAGLTAEGRPTRRPNRDCLVGESDATTSTDMQTGYILGALDRNNLAGLQRLANYADTHGSIMGTPETALHLVWMKPQTRIAIGLAVAHLGGVDAWSKYTLVPSPVRPEDYVLHLELLSFAITQRVGKWSFVHQGAARADCDRHPDDALAAVVCGDFDRAAALLLDPTWVPPHYVRGSDEAYRLVHKLYVLHLLLDR